MAIATAVEYSTLLCPRMYNAIRICACPTRRVGGLGRAIWPEQRANQAKKLSMQSEKAGRVGRGHAHGEIGADWGNRVSRV